MKAFLRQVFEDDKGQPSNMRFMSFLALVYSFFYCSFALWKEKPVDVEVLVLFVVAAFAPKVVQKFAERSQPKGGQ